MTGASCRFGCFLWIKFVFLLYSWRRFFFTVSVQFGSLRVLCLKAMTNTRRSFSQGGEKLFCSWLLSTGLFFSEFSRFVWCTIREEIHYLGIAPELTFVITARIERTVVPFLIFWFICVSFIRECHPITKNVMTRGQEETNNASRARDKISRWFYGSLAKRNALLRYLQNVALLSPTPPITTWSIK